MTSTACDDQFADDPNSQPPGTPELYTFDGPGTWQRVALKTGPWGVPAEYSDWFFVPSKKEPSSITQKAFDDLAAMHDRWRDAVQQTIEPAKLGSASLGDLLRLIDEAKTARALKEENESLRSALAPFIEYRRQREAMARVFRFHSFQNTFGQYGDIASAPTLTKEHFDAAEKAFDSQRSAA